MKNLLIVGLLTIGLFAEPKAHFSILIRPLEKNVKLGTPIQLLVKKTNLSQRALTIVGFNRLGDYDYYVWRDGRLVAETAEGKKLREPRSYEGGSLMDGSLPPHRTQTDTIAISTYRDMNKPGRYTIQLRQGDVKSNFVTITVTP
jgi:hypothetical protein